MNGSEGGNDSRVEKNSDISLIDLIITLLKYKWLIIGIVIITIIGTLAFLAITSADRERAVQTEDRVVQNLYYSECVIEPYAATVNAVLTILQRPVASVKLLERTEIYSVLYPNLWSAESQRWKTSEPPSRRDTYNMLKPNLGLFVSGNLFTIGYLSSNREVPQKIVDCYVTGLSEYLRQRDKELIESKIRILTRQMQLESDVAAKKNLSSEMINLKYSELRLKDRYYGFSILDYPSEPYKLSAKEVAHVNYKIAEMEKKIGGEFDQEYEKMTKKTLAVKKGHRGMTIFLMAFASLVFAAFLIFIIEYVNGLKENRHDQYMLLRRYLSFRVGKKRIDQDDLK